MLYNFILSSHCYVGDIKMQKSQNVRGITYNGLYWKANIYTTETYTILI